MASHDSSNGAVPSPPCSHRDTPLEEVPLLVTLLGGNVVTSAVVAACLSTTDATVLRRLHPAIATAVAAVPWADTTTTVYDITRWRTALPAAVGCTLSRGIRRNRYHQSVDADIARLPPALRSLDVSYCLPMAQDVSFVHLPALESLDWSGASVGVAGVASLSPSLRELRMNRCEFHEAVDFSHLTALRVLDCFGIRSKLSAATIASLPPSLDVFDMGDMAFDMRKWPSGGSFALLTRLRVLGVAGNRIDAPTLATFPPSLHSLNLGHCELAAAASFAHLHCLHTLDVSNSPGICDAVLATLPPSLVSLDLQSAGNRYDDSLTVVLPHLPALRVLNVSNTAINDAAVASMPPSLVELHMADCGWITHHASLDHLSALRVLQSSGTNLSPATLASCRARGCVAPADGIVVYSQHRRPAELLVPLPDGRLVSCTYTAGRVALWAAVSHGPPLARVQIASKHTSEPLRVRALAVLPDGHRVAIAASEWKNMPAVSSGIFMWDTRDATGAPHAAGVITSATIDFADGLQTSKLTALPNSHLVVGFMDGKLRIVDVEARAVLATLVGHTAYVTALVVLPDGLLASGANDTTVRLWDVDARVCIATLVGHTDPPYSIVALPDGRLASGSDGTVRLWDVGSAVCVGVLEGSARALAVFPGSHRLGGMTTDDKLLVWDTHGAARGALAATVELAGAAATALVPLPGGRLATGGAGVRLWQLPLDAVQAPP